MPETTIPPSSICAGTFPGTTDTTAPSAQQTRRGPTKERGILSESGGRLLWLPGERVHRLSAAVRAVAHLRWPTGLLHGLRRAEQGVALHGRLQPQPERHVRRWLGVHERRVPGLTVPLQRWLRRMQLPGSR